MERPIINTGKFGVLAEFPAHTDGEPQLFRYIDREIASDDYWEVE